MAPGPVRWPWMASSVPCETFPAGVRFRGWMSEAEGFLWSRLPASLTWLARPPPELLALSRQPDLCPGHRDLGSRARPVRCPVRIGGSPSDPPPRVGPAAPVDPEAVPRLPPPRVGPAAPVDPEAVPAQGARPRPSAPLRPRAIDATPTRAAQGARRPDPPRPKGSHRSDGAAKPSPSARFADSWQRIDGVS